MAVSDVGVADKVLSIECITVAAPARAEAIVDAVISLIRKTVAVGGVAADVARGPSPVAQTVAPLARAL